MPNECELISVTCNEMESRALQNHNPHEEHHQHHGQEKHTMVQPPNIFPE